MTAPLPDPRRWLQLADDAPRGRRASWLELFFDLVYVAAVSNLARGLLQDPTPHGLLVFCGLFVPVWWAWIGISYFLDQYTLPPLAQRLLMFSQLGLSVGLAAGLPGTTHGHPELFAGSYLALRVTLTLLYAWAWRSVPEGRELNGKYTLGFALGCLLWAASLFVPAPASYALWAAALALEIAATIWAYVSSRHVPAQVSHMPERFGLFTLIVLGETVLAVVTGSGHVSSLAGAGVAVCGLVLACAVWWLYFEAADERVIDRALRGGPSALLLSFVYGYTHLLVFAGIVAAGVGLELAIGRVGHGAAGAAVRLCLCGGLGAYLIGLSVVQWATPRTLPPLVWAARGVSVGLLALLGGWGDRLGLGPVALALPVAAILGLLVAVEWLATLPGSSTAADAVGDGLKLD